MTFCIAMKIKEGLVGLAVQGKVTKI